MKEVTLKKLNFMTYLTVTLNAAVLIGLTALMWNGMGRFLDIGITGRSIIAILALFNLLYFKRSKVCYIFAAVPQILLFSLMCLSVVLRTYVTTAIAIVAVGLLTINILSIIYLFRYLRLKEKHL